MNQNITYFVQIDVLHCYFFTENFLVKWLYFNN